MEAGLNPNIGHVLKCTSGPGHIREWNINLAMDQFGVFEGEQRMQEASDVGNVFTWKW